jgi:hypothetical protein
LTAGLTAERAPRDDTNRHELVPMASGETVGNARADTPEYVAGHRAWWSRSRCYPVWAGVGTVGALAAAYALFGERLVVGQWIGVALVLLGVVLINAPQLLGRNA